MLIALSEADDERRHAQARMHQRAQRPGAFAMNDAYAKQVAALALAEIVVQEVGDLRWTERVEIQFTRDRYLHWLFG